jgi:hypothetical protein
MVSMASAGTSISKHQHFAEVLHTNALPQRGHFFCSNSRSLFFNMRFFNK